MHVFFKVRLVPTRCLVRERGSVPKGGRYSMICVRSSVQALLVKCPSVQWQPDGLTIHPEKWPLGAGFLGQRASAGRPYTYTYTCTYTYTYTYT